MNKVILITGTPGVGKTTVTSLLQSQGYTTYNLYEIAEQMDCVLSFDEKRDAVIIDDDCLFDNIDEFIKNLDDDDNAVVIFEGHYADVVPKEFLLQCFVLSPPIDILRPRLVERGYDEEKIMENIEAHIMKECYYDALEYYGPDLVTEIEHMPPENIVEIIKKHL